GGTNAPIAEGQGVGTILNDDVPPSLAVSDASVTEGNTGTVNAVFTVTLSAAATQTVTVNYATSSGGATSGVDFTAASGTLTFAPRETSRTVAVAVRGDVLDENDETFWFDLSNPTNATISRSYGIGTILDDDPMPSVVINDVSVTEGNTGSVNATFTLTMSAASGRTA